MTLTIPELSLAHPAKRSSIAEDEQRFSDVERSRELGVEHQLTLARFGGERLLIDCRSPSSQTGSLSVKPLRARIALPFDVMKSSSASSTRFGEVAAWGSSSKSSARSSRAR